MREKLIKYLPVCICWIFASTGLIWQVYQVSEIFFNLSTRVDIDMDAPLNLTIPAITICLPLKPNIITLKTLIDVNNLSDDQIKEEVTYLPINLLSTLETIDVKVFCRTKYPRVIADYPDGQPCDLFGKTVHRIQYNHETKIIHRCTTYLIQIHEEPLTVIANEAKDFFALDVYSLESNIVRVYVHNPLEIINLPEADFFVIYTNQSSDIVVVSSWITINLPKDTFFSECSDYNELNFGRMSCIFLCRLRVSQTTCSSWSSEVPAPLDVKLPFRSRLYDCPRPRDYNCTSFEICPVQCKSVWYTSTLVWNHIKDKPSNLTRFIVRRPYGLEFVYNVTPSLALVEYSCYVASCLGIWFGISFSDIMLKLFGKSNSHQIKSYPTLSKIKVNYHRKIINHNSYDAKKKITNNHLLLDCFNSKLPTSGQIYQRKVFPSKYLYY